MTTLVKRSISGILIVAIVSGAMIVGQQTALGLMLLIFSISFLEFKRMFKIEDRSSFALLLFLGLLLLVLFYLLFSQKIEFAWIIGYVIVAFSLIILYSLTSNLSSFRDISMMTLGMFWISGSLTFFLASGWRLETEHYSPELPIILLSLIWINDAGAYLSGSLFGKHQLSPGISPGKTWEGFISGIIFTGFAGWGVSLLIDSYSTLLWISLAILMSLTSIVGDLFESKLKREAGVKDSGNVIPGHGGILDRFDSLFFSAPVFIGILILAELI